MTGLLLLAYAWRPFMTAMPVWDHWAWLAVPLCAGVAVVYKTTKVATPNRIVPEALALTVWILLGLIGAALAIAVFTRFT